MQTMEAKARIERAAPAAAVPESIQNRLSLSAPPANRSETPLNCTAQGKHSMYHLEADDPLSSHAIWTCHQGCSHSAVMNSSANKVWKTAGFKLGTCASHNYTLFKHNIWDKIFIAGAPNIAVHITDDCDEVYKNKTSNQSGVVTNYCEESCSHLFVGLDQLLLAGYTGGHCNGNFSWGAPRPYRHLLGEKTVSVFASSGNEFGTKDQWPAVPYPTNSSSSWMIHNDSVHVNVSAIGDPHVRRRILRRRRAPPLPSEGGEPLENLHEPEGFIPSEEPNETVAE